jgi:hypothetical protein
MNFNLEAIHRSPYTWKGRVMPLDHDMVFLKFSMSWHGFGSYFRILITILQANWICLATAVKVYQKATAISSMNHVFMTKPSIILGSLQISWSVAYWHGWLYKQYNSSVYYTSVSIVDRSKILQKVFKDFKSKARQGTQSRMVPRHEHFLPGTVFDRWEGDSWDRLLMKPGLLGSQGELVCLSLKWRNSLPFRTGIHIDQKAHCNVQLHLCRVSAKWAVRKQWCIKGDAVWCMLMIVVCTLNGWDIFAW